VSAPMFMRKFMEWSESLLRDDRVFPVSATHGYPPDFFSQVRHMYKRMLKVYGHIYLNHLVAFNDEAESTALNTSLLHFYLFGREFGLMSDQEVGPLMFVVEMLSSGRLTN
jgi:MOB kinase activator 1